MTQAEIRALALFFYFLLLDDRKAIHYATLALAKCNQLKKSSQQTQNSVIVVAVTSKIWKQIQSNMQRGLPNTSMESGWVLPQGLDLGPWREYQKKATDDELATVIWSKILGYSDAQISGGLKISKGTIRFRLAKAFFKLGSMVPKNSKISVRGVGSAHGKS